MRTMTRTYIMIVWISNRNNLMTMRTKMWSNTTIQTKAKTAKEVDEIFRLMMEFYDMNNLRDKKLQYKFSPRVHFRTGVNLL